MDDSILAHRATPEQLRHFDEQGYLVVDNALSAADVSRFTEVVDRVAAAKRSERGLSDDQPVDTFCSVLEDPALLDLVDWPATLPLAWEILGWNIQLYISHLSVFPPERDPQPGVVFGGWHQDGGRPVQEMERPHPRLSFKVSYWLSDTRGDDRGAMMIVPGAHRLDQLPPPGDDGHPEGAIELRVAPGTAVLFDRRMWHSRTHNTSGVTRKGLFFGYSYRWLRGLDYNQMPAEVLAGCDPIRRQLLGDGVTRNGWWQPRDEDVPLRTWLRARGLAE